MIQTFQAFFQAHTGRRIVFNMIGKGITAILVFVALHFINDRLSIAQYGVWTQFFFASKLLLPLVVMQLETVLVRYFEHSYYNAKQLWFALLVSIISFNLLLALIAFLCPEQITQLIFGSTHYQEYVPLLIAFTCSESLFLFLTSYFRASQRTEIMSAFRVIQGTGQLLVLLLCLLYWHTSLLAIIYSYLTINSLLVLFLISWIARNNAILASLRAFNFATFRAFLRYALPLTIAGFSAWLMYASDRFFLAHFHDLTQVGYYAAISIFGSLIFMLQDAINLLILPQCVSLWETGNKEMALKKAIKMSDTYLTVTGLLLIWAFLFGNQALLLFTASTINVASFWIGLLSLAYVLPGFDQRYITLLHLTQRTRQFANISIALAAINLVLNLIFIPDWGVYGAIVSTVLTYILRSGLIWGICRKKMLVTISTKPLLKVVLVVFLFIGIGQFLPVFLSLSEVMVLSLGIALLYGLMIWRLNLIDRSLFKKILN